MALTGLFLVSFLFIHLSGNLLLLSQDDGFSFNQFCHFMGTNPVIRVLEYVLFAGFIIHIATAYVLIAKNKSRRPVAYAVGSKTPRVSWYSKNMALTGTLILVFLVLHIKTFWYEFKFGTLPKVYYTEIVGVGEHNQASVNSIKPGEQAPKGVQVYANYTIIAKEVFAQPAYVIVYILSFVLLGMHLIHGFASGFQTLGLAHKKYTPIIRGLGLLISVVIPLGFALIPIQILFTQ